jgi:hypothetical protein
VRRGCAYFVLIGCIPIVTNADVVPDDRPFGKRICTRAVKVAFRPVTCTGAVIAEFVLLRAVGEPCAVIDWGLVMRLTILYPAFACPESGTSTGKDFRLDRAEMGTWTWI